MVGIPHPSHMYYPASHVIQERCPHFRGWYVQASMELGPEDVSLLERCPHFRGWYVQDSMELGPENVSLLERCPHFRGWYIQAGTCSWSSHLLCQSSTVSLCCLGEKVSQWCSLLNSTHLFTELASSCLAVEYD